jgi:hypothetical protein
VCIRVLHKTISRARGIQFTSSLFLSYLFTINFNIILLDTPMYPKLSIFFNFANWNSVLISHLPMHRIYPAHLTLPDFITLKAICEEYKFWSLYYVSFSAPCCFLSLRSEHFPQLPVITLSSVYVPFLMWKQFEIWQIHKMTLKCNVRCYPSFIYLKIEILGNRRESNSGSLLSFPHTWH